MPPQLQPKPPGKKKALVLSRSPVPPVFGGNAEIEVVGSRVVRLLRDARASVRAHQRPDTPLTNPPLPPLKRGSRLTTMVFSASEAPSQLMTSCQQFNHVKFESSLDAARGNPQLQLERLAELKLWLANPHHHLWDTTVARLQDLVTSPKTEAQVVVSAASVLLRQSELRNLSCLPLVVRRLHELCEGGKERQLLEEVLIRESLLQPLLHLAKSEELLITHTSVLWDVLEIFRSCSAKSNVILTQLVSLGMIPVANAVVKRILSSVPDSPSKALSPSSNLLYVLLPPLCLLYRNFSTQHSKLLRKLGSLDLLVDILDRFREDGDVVQAAARAMAKTVFDDCSLEHYQKGNRACRVVVAALEANLDVGGLAVSRLCGTLARLVEGSRELRDWLMNHHQPMLVRLVQTHVTPQRAAATANAEPPYDAEEAQQEDLLQNITWLVGVAAISAECSTSFVLEITPLLVEFVKDLDAKKWHLAFIYTLMCLSNLSFFFDALERMESSKEALVEIYATVGLILAGVLFDGDTEAAVEATRILGNMSLTNVGRDWMESNRCDEVCIVFLGHEDPRIVYNCFGVLLNLTAADACRVASDPQLMQMLLQHTGRYTREECIAAEKIKESSRCMTVSSTDEDGGLSYTDQIADIVEKLLHNLSGLF
ncbi:hypothetical protein TraAM80_07708 [Trypanosoma rangeli]|uniref:Uncharacterized protein n=1 Tax=Trypanosoma rangeli TaxID=5698 RepID=A0A3R7M6B4_TRYRA|nr:uncharacterized protein TraAM80_07708 [Trypanosoma rangeli]RNF00248.1 hypothetical protein TraAM80_07708 [Trypanosoma rangeli]|eukprot:RNF00248.1 hypothetical protein TraAM80_07708 [Trypanosoma rangeli]